ncbi:MAG: hypothetical protein Q4E53_00255 [Eubacteriales bacterium]|nr:hypothetical protein [Eubacteriales bacterium]
MATQINDTQNYMTFQSELIPQMIKQNNTLYTAFAGDYENKKVEVSFDIRVKNSIIKSNKADIIKNNHVILQKNMVSGIFFLFEADKKQFVEKEDGSKVFEETVKTNDYSYTITFIQKAQEEEEVKAEASPMRTGDISSDVNAILQKYGIGTEGEDDSPITDIIKSWKLGHPDA